ncbi:MAG TPA: hypothetical protein VHK24_02165, partial [Steroidobacter sp.]|nr:hypothetical protein [Steroidobacter sp.]
MHAIKAIGGFMLQDAQRDGVPVSLADKVRALKSPSSYAEPAQTIEAIETHFAWVFLAGAYAYKLKKPMRFAELDLATLAARHFVCREELRLSRRLAPDVYLGVTPLTREADGAIRVGGAGVAVEWLIKMRRLPSELMLDRAPTAGAALSQKLVQLGRLLAQFYLEQQRVVFDAHAYVRRMAQQIEQDGAALRSPDLHIARSLVEAVSSAQLAALGRVEPELSARAEEQRIV